MNKDIDVCLDCGSTDGTLLKEFNIDKNYSWLDLANMTPICASCGSKNIEVQND